MIALRENKRPVEYLVAPDEGHGFAGKENRLAMYAAMERFLAKHVGGRYQEAMAQPIAQRLASLTVDVSKVVLKPAVATSGPASAAQPAFAGESLRPATLKYAYKGQVMGRPIEGSSTLTIAAGKQADRAVWTMSEVSKTSIGDGKDTTVLDQKTLMPLGRNVQQGPASIDVEFTDKEARGKMKAGPQEMPINAKLDGAVLVDGMPLNVAVGTLPLAPGYTTPAAQLRSDGQQGPGAEAGGKGRRGGHHARRQVRGAAGGDHARGGRRRGDVVGGEGPAEPGAEVGDHAGAESRRRQGERRAGGRGEGQVGSDAAAEAHPPHPRADARPLPASGAR